MSGRRSHPRIAVVPATQGFLRLLHEVVVQQIEAGEVVAISREPGVEGEMLAIEMPTGPEVERLQCRVIDSRPCIVDGHLRHRLRLLTQPHRSPDCVPAPPGTQE
jgi:hypothetical protein